MKALASYPSVLQATMGLLTTAVVFAAPASNSVREVRFLALGDSPPYRQEIRDGVSVEIPPPPESIPPREVIAGSGNEPSNSVTLRLEKISDAVKFAVGEGNLVLRQGGASPGGTPWVSLKCPASGDLLVCLYRDPAKQSWKDVLSMILPASPNESPAGSVRIINVYSLPARVNLAGEVIEIPAGGSVLQPVKPDIGVQVRVEVADPNGKMRQYFSGEITQKPDERGWIAIYRADQPNPRRPVKVLVLREKVAPSSP